MAVRELPTTLMNAAAVGIRAADKPVVKMDAVTDHTRMMTMTAVCVAGIAARKKIMTMIMMKMNMMMMMTMIMMYKEVMMMTMTMMIMMYKEAMMMTRTRRMMTDGAGITIKAEINGADVAVTMVAQAAPGEALGA